MADSYICTLAPRRKDKLCLSVLCFCSHFTFPVSSSHHFLHWALVIKIPQRVAASWNAAQHMSRFDNAANTMHWTRTLFCLWFIRQSSEQKQNDLLFFWSVKSIREHVMGLCQWIGGSWRFVRFPELLIISSSHWSRFPTVLWLGD